MNTYPKQRMYRSIATLGCLALVLAALTAPAVTAQTYGYVFMAGGERQVTLSGISLNGGSNFATVSPGAAVQLALSYTVNTPANAPCSGCRIQLYAGINGASKGGCFASQQFLPSTKVGPLLRTMTLTAPTSPGTYYVGFGAGMDKECQINRSVANDTAGTFGSVQVVTTPPAADKATAWLEAHNQLRTPLNVPALQWDAALAAKAQGYADRLAQNGTANNHCMLGHNLYGYSLDVMKYGENLAGAWKTDEGPAAAVKGWASEQPFFDSASCQCVTEECRHYTQVISQWSKTLGCGQAACKDDNGTWHYYVCNYQGPGNLKISAQTLKAPYPAACAQAQK